MKTTVQYGGGSIMIWPCFAAFVDQGGEKDFPSLSEYPV